jgi:hypothetical protein
MGHVLWSIARNAHKRRVNDNRLIYYLLPELPQNPGGIIFMLAFLYDKG